MTARRDPVSCRINQLASVHVGTKRCVPTRTLERTPGRQGHRSYSELQIEWSNDHPYARNTLTLAQESFATLRYLRTRRN